MIISNSGDNFILKPQTALDHIFLDSLLKSGRVDEAYALALQSLRLDSQPLTIGSSQQSRDMTNHYID